MEFAIDYLMIEVMLGADAAGVNPDVKLHSTGLTTKEELACSA